MGIEHSLFEREIASLKREANVVNDNELNEEQLRTLIVRYKGVYEKEGKMFPQEPLEQMRWGLAPTRSEPSLLDLNDSP